MFAGLEPRACLLGGHVCRDLQMRPQVTEHLDPLAGQLAACWRAFGAGGGSTLRRDGGLDVPAAGLAVGVLSCREWRRRPAWNVWLKTWSGAVAVGQDNWRDF